MPTDEDYSRERILVLRFSSLGDVLLIAPAVRALGRRFPEAQIDLLVAHEFHDAAALIPGLDNILTFDRAGGVRELLRIRALISRRYAVLVDLQNSLRSAFLRLTALPTIWVKARRYRVHRWLLIRTKRDLYPRLLPVPKRYLAALEPLGITDDGRGLELRRQLSGGELSIPERYVVLCPGAKHATKRWPPDRWLELGRLLQRDGFQLVLLGSDNERAELSDLARGLSHPVVRAGLPMSEVAWLIQNADCVVSNDSGLMHLACGLNVPVVAIFGPTVEQFGFFPFRARAEIVQNPLPCRPCSAMGSNRCPRSHFRCMLDSPAERVAAAVARCIAAPTS